MAKRLWLVVDRYNGGTVLSTHGSAALAEKRAKRLDPTNARGLHIISEQDARNVDWVERR